jgi:hypothetical protein
MNECLSLNTSLVSCPEVDELKEHNTPTVLYDIKPDKTAIRSKGKEILKKSRKSIIYIMTENEKEDKTETSTKGHISVLDSSDVKNYSLDCSDTNCNKNKNYKELFEEEESFLSDIKTAECTRSFKREKSEYMGLATENPSTKEAENEEYGFTKHRTSSILSILENKILQKKSSNLTIKDATK